MERLEIDLEASPSEHPLLLPADEAKQPVDGVLEQAASRGAAS